MNPRPHPAASSPAPTRPRLRRTAAIALISALLPAVLLAAPRPLALHPDNPHYLLFRDRPILIVTSAEHYGAVLNRDFDSLRYLDTLAAAGLNGTRIFSGAYCENVGAFRIVHNTLAPAAGRFICPWARSGQPGYAGGGTKFDLSRWDDAYFARLRDFVREAGRRAIVVEYVFFCPFYRDEQWQLSPLNPANNINGLTPAGGEANATYTLDRHGGLLEVQERLIAKVTAELSAFDNLYYEICNEPYARKLPADWERHLAGVIARADRAAGAPHLISQNVANGNKQVVRVQDPHPAIGILNFHYAYPPENTVTVNYGLDRVLGENETGFRGHGDDPYLIEAWEFLLAGGALFNNLDYSFAVGHESGDLEVTGTTPGGGGPTLRRQLAALRRFLEGFEFVRLKPDTSFVVSAQPTSTRVRALAEPGRQYALYASGPAAVTLAVVLPHGRYRAEWIEPRTTATLGSVEIEARGAPQELTSPSTPVGVALRLRRID